MLKQLRRMRGKAPGPSGWTADALCQLVDDLDVRQGMLALVGAIMNNIVPPDLRYLLVARDLCLVPKQPVPRPIAKGDVFVKLASRIAYQRISLKVKVPDDEECVAGAVWRLRVCGAHAQRRAEAHRQRRHPLQG